MSGIIQALLAGFGSGGAASSDPYFQNVSLLMHMDGTNGGTTFTDNSNYALTVTPTNATTSTTQVKFGTASAYFNGTNAYLSTASLPSNFLTQSTSIDYTIECWVYPTATPSGLVFFAGQAGGYFPVIGMNASRQLFGIKQNASTFLTFTSAVVSLNTWQHVCLVKTGTTVTAYINGVASGTNTDATTIVGSNTGVIEFGR